MWEKERGHREVYFIHFTRYCLILMIFYFKTSVHSRLPHKTALSGSSVILHASFPPISGDCFSFWTQILLPWLCGKSPSSAMWYNYFHGNWPKLETGHYPRLLAERRDQLRVPFNPAILNNGRTEVENYRHDKLLFSVKALFLSLQKLCLTETISPHF